MARSIREVVWQRARARCEYCHLPQHLTDLPHQLDHIRARKHRGTTIAPNLALSCAYCNGHKGPNVSGYDPQPGLLVPLFNPRTDSWNEHFEWDGPLLVGKNPIARATVEVLGINATARIHLRQSLIQLGARPF